MVKGSLVLTNALLAYHQNKAEAIRFGEFAQTQFYDVLALYLRLNVQLQSDLGAILMRSFYLMAATHVINEKIQELGQHSTTIEEQRKTLPQLNRLYQTLRILQETVGSLTNALQS